MTDYDAIVIGSGAGGLAAAVALAQSGQKVLICEQHEVAGGWMHSFTLEGYRFNTGVHYIGELGPGERLRKIYEGLGVACDLTFMELNPDGYDHILLGAERFDIPKGREAYRRRLEAAFPHETRGIERLFDTLADVNQVLQEMIDERWLHVFDRPLALPWFVRSGGALIDHYVSDPLLRGILKAQAGDHGMPPSQVSAAIHAAVIEHYSEGAYHPLGGGMTIARAFVRALRRAGGELRLKQPVRRILLDGRRAAGVELESGEWLTASSVLSNADPHQTFSRLIGREALSPGLQRKLSRVGYSTSCLSLYLVVDCDLEAMGIDSGNYWIYADEDIDGIYQRATQGEADLTQPEMVFATVTSLKDPSKRRDGRHQLEVFTFAPYEKFARWRDQPSGERDEAYQSLKEAISEGMIEIVERRFPGIRDSIVFMDLGTPLTNQHYIRAYRGNIYGTDKGIWQAGPLGFRAGTEFDGLYLCGASTMAHGVAYATNSGLTAAGKILGCDPHEFLRSPQAELVICQCEDPSTWPSEYRDRGRLPAMTGNTAA
jgi:all-trans-retinol 13,14-reductase